MDLNPRPIDNTLGIVNPKPEKEKPSRWSFMKVLREHSDLKELYPDIDPYVEGYRWNFNTLCIFSPSIMEACGDVWSYLIVGPEKALLIDTAFGLGNLRGLAEHLADGKEVICANTHKHVDHIGGNVQFDRVYINEYDAEGLRDQMTPGYMPSFLFDKRGRPTCSGYRLSDMSPFKDYEIIAAPDGHVFDLGQGYEIELVHLSGHTAGQSGFFDRQTGCFFIGDMTSALLDEGERYPELCTIRSMRDRLEAALERLGDKLSGVYPGHGTFDLHPVTLQYMVDTANRILAHPEQPDIEFSWFGRPMYARMIYQFGSDLKYTADTVG